MKKLIFSLMAITLVACNDKKGEVLVQTNPTPVCFIIN